jgi:hypothetical protein
MDRRTVLRIKDCTVLGCNTVYCTLKVEREELFEKLVTIYKTTRHHCLEDYSRTSRCCVNPRVCAIDM